MARSRRKHPKHEALKDRGSLHPRPEKVSDELFVHEEFFDPCDLVQVKYEMLRRVRVDRQPIQNAARAFGLSRPTFYQAQTAYERAGVVGLLPAKRGPRRAHKLSESVMAFVRKELASNPAFQAPELARRVKEHFGFAVHPRSIQRALARQKKTE
jgi:transposase